MWIILYGPFVFVDASSQKELIGGFNFRQKTRPSFYEQLNKLSLPLRQTIQGGLQEIEQKGGKESNIWIHIQCRIFLYGPFFCVVAAANSQKGPIGKASRVPDDEGVEFPICLQHVNKRNTRRGFF